MKKNLLRISDKSQYDKDQAELIDSVRKDGDSVGGVILEVRSIRVPAGLGSPVFEKIDAKLASAIMSIGGVEGFEIGTGFSIAEKRGSEVNDIILSKKRWQD